MENHKLPYLPPELLRKIASFLHKDDVGTFRLADTRCATAAIPFLTPTVNVRFITQDFQRLCDIASHPLLRHYVHEIRFIKHVFPPCELALRCEEHNHEIPPDLGHCWSESRVKRLISSNALDPVHTNGQELPSSLLASTSNGSCYQHLIRKMQEKLMTAGFGGLVRYLGLSLQHLSNLQGVQILDLDLFYQIETYASGQRLPHVSWESQAIGNDLMTVLGSLEYNPKLKLKRFDHFRINRRVFDDQAPWLSSFARSMENLTWLDLGLIGYLDNVPISGTADALSRVGDHDRGLRLFLKRLVKIECLFLDHGPNHSDIARLETILGNLHFPCLREFTIDGLRVHQDGFTDFFKAHAATLRRVELEDLCLEDEPDITWAHLLFDLKQFLQLERFKLWYKMRTRNGEHFFHVNDKVTIPKDFILDIQPPMPDDQILEIPIEQILSWYMLRKVNNETIKLDNRVITIKPWLENKEDLVALIGSVTKEDPVWGW